MTFHFQNLFTLLRIGPITIKNRIFVTPHATGFASDGDNLPGERFANYCAERARGGAGLIEVSMGIISNTKDQSILAPDTEAHFHPLSGSSPLNLTGRWPIRGSDPRVVEGYARLARSVHEHGAKCVIEIAGGGTNNANEFGVSQFPWPSSLPFTSREMDEKEIEESIEAFGVAGKYVRESGVDGIDLHASHGLLISEFLSAVMNRRKDRYGGSLESRMRFLLEVIQRVREYIGSDIALGMRLMGDERYRGGNGPEEAVEISKRVDGKVDWITADMGNSPQQEEWQAVPMYIESGYNLRISSPIKAAVVKSKVGVVGRYVDPHMAEKLVSEELADMVAMTRALIADPELPNKARLGMIEDIRPCIGVLQDCFGRMTRGLPMSCTVNPVVSREKEWGNDSLNKASIEKKILVIGGGPAGLEAARVAAERGHKVVIYEKTGSLGGQALLAAKLPGRVDIRSIISWETNQLKKLQVDIKYRMEVTNESQVIDYILSEEKPDVVIVATGSIPLRDGFQPYTFNQIEGWEQPIVCTDVDVLEPAVALGHKVIIADTIGFIEAPGLAEYAAKQGSEVEVVTHHANIGLELKLVNQLEHVMPRIYSVNVKVSPYTWVRKISGKSVYLYNVFKEQEERRVENVDNLVLITGKIQNDSLYFAFKSKVKEVYRIGDANIAGARLGYAIYDGQRIGRTI